MSTAPSQSPIRQPPKKVPIDREQIDMAKDIIKENHPLNDTPLSTAFPIFKICTSCKKNDKVEQQEPLLPEHMEKKNTKKQPQKQNIKVSEEEKNQDPFLLLGFGLIAYRDLLQTFIVLFTILSLLMFPAMYFYGYGGYYGYGEKGGAGYSKWSLGNMGYSQVSCENIPYSIGKLTLNCNYGQIGQVLHFGVIPETAKYKDICAAHEGNECAPFINEPAFNFEENCHSHTNCTFDLKETSIFASEAPPGCISEDAMVFAQFTCVHNPQLLNDKYFQGTLISSCGVLACLLFLTTIYFLKKNSKIKQLEWDCATITAGDYTVEFKISEKAYQSFRDNEYDPKDKARGISIGESFKAYLKNQMESMLNQLLKEKKSDSEDNKLKEVKIADIVFAFNNRELIQLLRERGAHIMYQRYDKMREVEEQISNLKKDKFLNLTRPVSAFITFEEEDAYNLAQEYEPEYTWRGHVLPAKKQFLEDELYLIPATEPTNILWENRQYTYKDRLKRTIQVIAIIFVLILISFGIIYICKSIPIKMNKVWKSTDCSVVEDTYGNTLTKYAYIEWNSKFGPNTPIEDKKYFQMNGVLSCFCKQQHVGWANKTVEIASKIFEPAPICREYVEDQIASLGWTQAAGQAIVVINYVLRLFIIKLIIYIGKDTESEQTRLITNGVFIVQFFNTGILLLLVNANLSEQNSLLGIFVNGQLKDFNAEWFSDIGNTMIGAMMFNIYWPLIEFFCFYGMRLGYRMLDRGCGCNEYKTKKTTLQQYVEVYSGPVYYIHYKYSAILNITFVTFMYGLGLPILFPIAVLAFLVLYLVEKTMIYYSYRQPPVYDDLLNNNALYLLSYAPLLFLSFGYWMFSNHQLFASDTLIEFNRNSDPKDSGHIWYEVLTPEGWKFGPAFPLILMFWVILLFLFFRNSITKLLYKISNFFKVGEMELDEDIDNYYNCLDDHDRKWSIMEEENSRSVMLMNILNNETLEKLKSTKMGKGHLQGVHSYDILANPLYLDDFQYFSADLPDRAKYIIDDDEDEDNDNAQSDLVRMVLNLAFLHEERAKTFTFSKDTYKKHVKSVNKIN